MGERGDEIPEQRGLEVAGGRRQRRRNTGLEGDDVVPDRRRERDARLTARGELDPVMSFDVEPFAQPR